MADTKTSDVDNFAINEAWLAKAREVAIDPDMPIVDPHHHIWDWPFRYGMADWLIDLESGHKVVATIHTEAHGHYRTDGPEHLKPVGETEYLVGIAKEAAKFEGAPKICAGIVGGGDLTSEKVDALVEAHIAAGEGRFRGIRINPFWTFDKQGNMSATPGWEDVVNGQTLENGIKCLQRHGLLVEFVAHHPNLIPIANLAQRHANITCVVNHMAMPKDPRPNAPPEAALMTAWRHGIDAIAGLPNVYIKLGGAMNPMTSTSIPAFVAFGNRDMPPSSLEIANAHRPYVSYCIERLGPLRCMFESNFPMDKIYCSYVNLWNAFKRLAGIYGRDEQRALLGGNAAHVYRVSI